VKVRIKTKVILENKPTYKVTRNNKDLVREHTTFIIENKIAVTCFGCTNSHHQTVRMRKCKKKIEQL